jgi:MFS superfamily sulfate permease-like transporter
MVEDIEKITSKFNRTLQNKLLINLDKLPNFDHTATTVFERLKNLITEKKQVIELKNIKIQEMKYSCNFIIIINSKHPIKLNSTDKKYVLFECKEMYDSDDEYFKQLAVSIINQRVGDHFLTYLL